MYLQLPCPGQHGIRQREHSHCADAGQKGGLERRRVPFLLDDEVGVFVALTGVPDNGCLFNAGLAQLVKGTGGLFLR